jgi:ABC-type proline/glycine betaine transport system substrate-binding protein
MAKKLWAMFLAALLLLSNGCGGKERSIVLVDAGWDSIRIHNEIVRIIAKAAYNINVEILASSTPVTYAAIKRGDADVQLEVWTDNIAAYRQDAADGAFVELGVNFADNRQGLYVPRYVIEGDPARGIKAAAPALRSVDDLRNYPDVFVDQEKPEKGRIYGALPGWEADEVIFRKFKYYRLDETFNYFRPGSDAALYAAFVAAYQRGLPIVGYLWEPTWLTGQYDMVLLSDAPYSGREAFLAGQTAFPAMTVAVLGSNSFVKREPAFAAFLRKYQTSSAYTAEALAYLAQSKNSYAKAAIYMLKKYPEFINRWLDTEKAERVRAYINQ